jgi:DNA-binding transcriptional MocR family regulator
MRAREFLDLLEPLDGAEVDAASLAAGITDAIRRRRLPAGVDMPSERDLADALGRSRGLVARAYERLRVEGLAHTRHGAATTVGCCQGPWASSRAAQLAPLVRPALRPAGSIIDLREPRWELLENAEASEGDRAPATTITDGGADARSALLDGLGSHLESHGVTPGHLHATGGVMQAFDVVLAALLRPGDRVLVPALLPPRLQALLRIRGVHPVALPLDETGRADLPSWLSVIRSRQVGVALLTASHAAPTGAVLHSHERQLLVEAAEQGALTIVEDLSYHDLWITRPPPPPLASFGPGAGDRTLSVGGLDASLGGRQSLGWLHTSDDAVSERVAVIIDTLGAEPAWGTLEVVARSYAGHAALHRRWRDHLAQQLGIAIRAVTPVAPRITVAPCEGGPYLWLPTVGMPGSRLADAVRERGLLVGAGSSWTLGSRRPEAVALAVTCSPEELAAALEVIVDEVRILSP